SSFTLPFTSVRSSLMAPTREPITLTLVSILETASNIDEPLFAVTCLRVLRCSTHRPMTATPKVPNSEMSAMVTASLIGVPLLFSCSCAELHEPSCVHKRVCIHGQRSGGVVFRPAQSESSTVS